MNILLFFNFIKYFFHVNLVINIQNIYNLYHILVKLIYKITYFLNFYRKLFNIMNKDIQIINIV